METDLREVRTIDERLEGPGDEVVAIDGGANLRGEEETVVLPESCETPPLLELKLAMPFQGFYGLLRELYAALPFGGLGATEDGIAVL